MQGYLLVFLGAGIGGALRHGVNMAAVRLLPNSIGVSTLFVNVIGCFAMGVLVEMLALKTGATQAQRLFLATGVLGGFTTFSAFAIETVLLNERGQLTWAIANVIASVVLCIVAAIAGLVLVRSLAA
jgi:CrcB protein